MEFPKKITKSYPPRLQQEVQPKIIIRGCGNPPLLKYAEYVLTKSVGSMFIYKRR